MLVVSSWFPSALDPVAGRFVADQIVALAARGNVDPAVVSFDPAELIGSGPVRARIANVIASHVRSAAHAREPLFVGVRVAGGVVPVARLGIPSGRYREVGATHARAARIPALEALAERWVRGIEADVPRPALIHAHTVYPDGAAAAHLARRLACPLVLTEHASAVGRLIASPEVRAAYLETVRMAERLIVVSRVLADELIQAMPEIEPKVVVIPNGVDLGAFRPVSIDQRQRNELLFVGYRKPSKGISTLLRALPLVLQRHPDVRLRLIGGSPTDEIEAGWHREATSLRIDHAVTFQGPADRSVVADAMARASLFVHPSPRETFGVVAVEALASGLPVVATDSGGVTEILGEHPDELGAIVAPDRPDLLAAAIITALERRDEFDPATLRLAAAGRFDVAIVAERLEAVYQAASVGGSPIAPNRERSPAPEPRVHHVVVALDSVRAAEAGRLALGAARPDARMALVTTTASQVPDGAFEHVVRLPEGIRLSGLADAAVLRSGRGGLSRWLQLVRHPVALARRRGWLGGLEDATTGAGDGAIREAIRLIGTVEPPDAIELICLDGVDHLAADAVIREGLARPWAGGVRRLGDVLSATRRS